MNQLDPSKTFKSSFWRRLWFLVVAFGDVDEAEMRLRNWEATK